jgi:hypothetical protein
VLGGHSATLLVRLSALAPPDVPALQLLNASRAVPQATAALQREQGGASPILAADVAFGALRPQISLPLIPLVGVELRLSRGASPVYVQQWASVVSEALEPGRGYVLAYVGPDPASPRREAGNPPRFSLITGE